MQSFIFELVHFESCFKQHFYIKFLFVLFDFEVLDIEIQGYDFLIKEIGFIFLIIKVAFEDQELTDYW